ncbi:DUF4430 domain-containing protein [bacterium]|nr:MAG: DUF4430 domain-containing protein [bacterium]
MENISCPKNFKKITLIVAFVIFAIAAIFFLTNRDKTLETINGASKSSLSTSQTSEVISEGKTFTFTNGIEGANAFVATQNVFEIKFEDYPGIGKFVTSINGIIANNNGYFWLLKINGEDAQSGAEDTILKANDKVEWVYTKID